MHRRYALAKHFTFSTVSKKIFFLSKLLGIAVIAIYSFSSNRAGAMSDLVFLSSIVILVFAWDALLHRMITIPIEHISETAQHMADLDFSKVCRVHSRDEFHTLAENLNRMAKNLQNTLSQRKELTDTLSHELKTPLGIIRAYAEGLRDSTNQEKQRAYTEVIIEETEKMAGMINSLLELSAWEAGAISLKKQHFDFVELVETVAGRELMVLPSDSIHITYELPDTPIFVEADMDRMEQVLHNLISNAKKFVNAGGNIHLTLRPEKDKLYFSVYNDAPHLSNEELTAVWQKFHRDKSERNKHGSGLGLAICAQILSRQGADYGARN
ncbi:MAG: histidine kinase dimerization/phospho-acceptor domain-containing protein, partial [Thermacetogeniaceae bacterium]